MNAHVIDARAGVPPLLEVRDLSKRFGATRALAGVTRQFHASQVHCVLGENGAGKSTLGKLIGGLYEPDEGEIWLGGQALGAASPRRARAAGIAIVHQELALAAHLSVRANLWLGSEARRNPFAILPRSAETQRAKAVLGRLGLSGLDPETRLGELPVAIHQLIEIGRSLMFEPRVIVFDEPTAMLGAIEKQRFFDVVRTLKRDGIAAILITHHTDDVVETADHVTVMRDGRVVDSFPMHDGLTGEAVVARLTGKSAAPNGVPGTTDRRARAARLHAPGDAPAARPHVVEIDAVPTSAGPGMLGVAAGRILGFYGVVGCGAEAIVHGLAGLTTPAAPLAFRLDGRPYRPRSPAQALAQGVAYLPAGRARNGILPHRSIAENLLLTQWPRIRRGGLIAPSRERTLARNLLLECGVKFGSDEDSIDSLSGGNQQKVLLARAMAGATRLLLLEEPSAGVDIEAKRQIHARVRALAAEGVAVILLSSDLPEALALCDTLVTLFDGHVAGRYDAPGEHHHAAIVADVLGQPAPLLDHPSSFATTP